MKKLIIYDDTNKNIISIYSPADSTYRLLVEDVPDDKEITGIDNTGHLILKDREATNEDNKKLQKELEDKNTQLSNKNKEIESKNEQLKSKDKELEEKELKNEELTDKIIELTAQNLINNPEEE